LRIAGVDRTAPTTGPSPSPGAAQLSRSLTTSADHSLSQLSRSTRASMAAGCPDRRLGNVAGRDWAVLALTATTLACNVGYGVAHGWPGALLSGWPAVAFMVAAETAITMTRQRPAEPAPGTGTPALDGRPIASRSGTG
jgi:hypothetical protein